MKYIYSLDRSRRCRIKAHNHYDTRLYFILLFREAGCAMFGFMLYSRRRSCFLSNHRSKSMNFKKEKRRRQFRLKKKKKRTNLSNSP